MNKSKGFTLLELVAVMVIVAIFAAYMTIRAPAKESFSLSSVTDQLRRDIRYTQSLAMGLDASYTITISASSYSISPTPPGGAVSVTMPTGVTLTPATITFSSMGAPGAAASITVTAAGVGSNVLTVSAETGFVNG